MQKDDLLLKLDELFELEPGTLNGSEPLESIENWDSIKVLEFMALLDDNFEGIEISPKQIAACKTVGDLVGLAGSRVLA
jgi:acyl carrier protein